MYILTAQQLKEWDLFTIQQEPVASIDLMERAALASFKWINLQKWKDHAFRVFCGKGNNGGDGLAIARMLAENNYTVSVCILESVKKGAEDFEKNLDRLRGHPSVFIQKIDAQELFPLINTTDILIDALFGTGIHQPVIHLAAALIDHINHSKAMVVSIDLPSGLLADSSSKHDKVIMADHTLTFQCYKMGLLVQENAPFIGQVHVLEIGLHPAFMIGETFNRTFLSEELIRQIYRRRPVFAHKGHFGHALLIAGSYGKIGAAVLSARACLRSGIGLLTCYLPGCGFTIMQTAVPEAMVITDENYFTVAQLPSDLEKYDVVGIGPGLGTAPETLHLLTFIVKRCIKPLVIDADGLNCIAQQPSLLDQLPPLSILTPHPKEFDRLFGVHANDFDRISTAEKKSKQHNIIIVLKGHHSIITTPDGKLYVNSTGNAGMAKGGSGDVLTGIIISLAAQYEPIQAAIMGTYLHGASGDFAASELSQESMTASDLITFLSHAFLRLQV